MICRLCHIVGSPVEFLLLHYNLHHGSSHKVVGWIGFQKKRPPFLKVLWKFETSKTDYPWYVKHALRVAQSNEVYVVHRFFLNASGGKGGLERRKFIFPKLVVASSSRKIIAWLCKVIALMPSSRRDGFLVVTFFFTLSILFSCMQLLPQGTSNLYHRTS